MCPGAANELHHYAEPQMVLIIYISAISIGIALRGNAVTNNFRLCMSKDCILIIVWNIGYYIGEILGILGFQLLRPFFFHIKPMPEPSSYDVAVPSGGG